MMRQWARGREEVRVRVDEEDVIMRPWKRRGEEKRGGEGRCHYVIIISGKEKRVGVAPPGAGQRKQRGPSPSPVVTA